MKPTYTYHDFIRDLRQGSFTSIGSYPLFFLMSDGETMSPQAARQNALAIGRATRDGLRDGWAVVGCGVNWEDMKMVCCDSGEPIECAYPRFG